MMRLLEPAAVAPSRLAKQMSSIGRGGAARTVSEQSIEFDSLNNCYPGAYLTMKSARREECNCAAGDDTGAPQRP